MMERGAAVSLTAVATLTVFATLTLTLNIVCRISRGTADRDGFIYSLTYRVGRHVPGIADIFLDLLVDMCSTTQQARHTCYGVNVQPRAGIPHAGSNQRRPSILCLLSLVCRGWRHQARARCC